MLTQIPGVDMNEGLRRTGNQYALYMRFLKQFPEDPSFSVLHDALLSGDMHTAFLSAHTLKGLTAQLGITVLCAPASELCELLRSESCDTLPRALELLDALKPVYHDVVRQLTVLP